jgi:hypothetical protein
MAKEKKIVWSRKGTPKQWGTEPWFPNDEDIKKIKKIYKNVERAIRNIQLSLTEDMQKKLWQAVDRYIYQTRNLKAVPTIPERRRLMENLRNSAEAFRLSLNDIRDTKIKRTIPIPYDLKSEQEIRRLMKTARVWENAAREAIPQGKTGPSPDLFRTELIFALIRIYEKATGKKAEAGYFYKTEDKTVGEFVNFTEAIFNSIDKQIYQSGRTLVENILPQAISAFNSSDTADS